jgi:hypothetical protein
MNPSHDGCQKAVRRTLDEAFRQGDHRRIVLAVAMGGSSPVNTSLSLPHLGRFGSQLLLESVAFNPPRRTSISANSQSNRV